MTSSCVAFESVGLNVHPSAILSSSALRIDLTYLSPVLDSRPNESMNHSLGGTVRTSPADRSGSMCKPFSCLRSRSSVVPFFTRYSTRSMRPLSLAWTLAPMARDFLEIFGLKVSSGSLSGVSFFSLYSRV